MLLIFYKYKKFDTIAVSFTYFLSNLSGLPIQCCPLYALLQEPTRRQHHLTQMQSDLKIEKNCPNFGNVAKTAAKISKIKLKILNMLLNA